MFPTRLCYELIVRGRICRREGTSTASVRVAIFGDPRGAGEHLLRATHILDRRARDHRAVKVGALRHRRADENAAVRAARDRDLALGADAGLDQLLGDGVEIVDALLDRKSAGEGTRV